MGSSLADSIRQLLPAIATVVTGVATTIVGMYLETRNPRSNTEDDIAVFVLGSGLFLIGAGIMLPLTHNITSPLIRATTVIWVGICFAFCVYGLLVVAYFTLGGLFG